MQPYMFPYIGYFQLIASSDKFLLYDDVQYIKKGWINRNRIMQNGETQYINIQLLGASSNKKINEIGVSSNAIWKKKLLKRIRLVYGKSPFFKQVFPLVEEIIMNDSTNLSDYLAYSIETLVSFLGVRTLVSKTSGCYNNIHLTGEDRIIDICKKESATEYLNASGGHDLYEKENFEKSGVKLLFLKPLEVKGEIPVEEKYLSIIHLLFQFGPVMTLDSILKIDIEYC